MNALAEQRRHLRKQVFIAAQIVFSGTAPTLECTARDLSVQGVRLAFQQHTEFQTGLMSSSTESANLLAPFGELAQKLA